MARLQIVRLRIETRTSAGLYGADMQFDLGLNVIHAENTLGKSSCLQAILYALGLEGTLGPSRAVPLKAVLTRELRLPDASVLLVMETNVYLELLNAEGQRITIRRSSDEGRKDLVTVWEGREIGAQLDKLAFTDYFVRMEGASVRERGFHHYLADFLQLELPQVLKYDGGECPLYLEAIFAVNYVEQTRGWGGILNVLPTYLGIQNLLQQVIEFTLALDAQELRKKRREAEDAVKAVEQRWVEELKKMHDLAASIGGRVVDLPDQPRKNADALHLWAISVTVGDEEVALDDAIARAKQALAEQREAELPTVAAAANTINRELEEKTARLKQLEKGTASLVEDMDTAAEYVQSINVRTDALNESLRKYKDVKRLLEIGSQEKFKFVERRCPTCGQGIADSLLPHVHHHEVLGVDDNIAYLEKQIKVLGTLRLSEEKRRADKERTLLRARRQLADLRASIRAIKDSLVSANHAPSKEAVRKEIELETRVDELIDVNERAAQTKDDLRAILRRWELAKSAVDALQDDFSMTDRLKLRTLEASFKTLLERFDYKSTPLVGLVVSERTYRPSIENVDLGSEASASDNIRMIWAYLYALLIVARQFATNHLGLLILDEPRQQEAKKMSFNEFIKVAAESREAGQQVIVATSENFDELRAATEGLAIKVMHFDSELIAPLNPV